MASVNGGPPRVKKACFGPPGVPAKSSSCLNTTFRERALVFLGFGRYKPGFHLFIDMAGGGGSVRSLPVPAIFNRCRYES